MRTVALLATFMLAACGPGTIEVTDNAGDERDTTLPHRDVGHDVGHAPDTSGMLDDDVATDPGDAAIIEPDVDDVSPPVCDPADCGTGASCQNNVCTCDAGLLGDPYQGCSSANPCENVSCAAGSSCNPDGSCSCDSFFTADGAGVCQPRPADTNLAARTAADVCAIWTAPYSRSSSDFWMVEPTTECDFGVLHPELQRAALHVTSQYRILVGLHPVSLAAGNTISTQACATTHAAEDAGLDHYPPDTWKCYTPEGAAGAGSSNLASGVGEPAGSVGLYVHDNGVASLGHRRWIFNPRMGATAFGHRGRYGAMYAFDGSRNHTVDFVAYPSPGAFPRAALGGKWSIHGGANYRDSFGVAIRNTLDDSSVAVSNITAPAFGNLASTLSWNVGSAAVDIPYEITITNDAGEVVRQYTTTLVNCP